MLRIQSIDWYIQQLLTVLSGGRSIFQTARNGPIKVKHVPGIRIHPRIVKQDQSCRNPLVHFTSIQEAISKRASGVSARTTLYFCIIETSVYVAYWIFSWEGRNGRSFSLCENLENYHCWLIEFQATCTKSVYMVYLSLAGNFCLPFRCFIYRFWVLLTFSLCAVNPIRMREIPRYINYP